MNEQQPDDFPLPGDEGALPDLDRFDLDLPAPAISPAAPPGPKPSLAPLHEIPIMLEAVLGHVTMTIDDLLGLGTGSVIEVDRRVGEPIDLVVGGRVLARGELVLIDGALGLTLTEIVRREGL